MDEGCASVICRYSCNLEVGVMLEKVGLVDGGADVFCVLAEGQWTSLNLGVPKTTDKFKGRSRHQRVGSPTNHGGNMSKNTGTVRGAHTFGQEDFTYLEILLNERDELLKALTWLVNVIDGPTNKRNVLVNLPDALANARKVINSKTQKTSTSRQQADSNQL